MFCALLHSGKRARGNVFSVLIVLTLFLSRAQDVQCQPQVLDDQLYATLAAHHFTGRIETKVREKLGRPIDQKRADLGPLLWFDIIGGLNDDNTCGGCHSPTNGFGDTQPIAIGIDNNLVVGPHRTGPRNQRRTPLAANTAL